MSSYYVGGSTVREVIVCAAQVGTTYVPGCQVWVQEFEMAHPSSATCIARSEPVRIPADRGVSLEEATAIAFAERARK